MDKHRDGLVRGASLLSIAIAVLYGLLALAVKNAEAGSSENTYGA